MWIEANMDKCMYTPTHSPIIIERSDTSMEMFGKLLSGKIPNVLVNGDAT